MKSCHEALEKSDHACVESLVNRLPTQKNSKGCVTYCHDLLIGTGQMLAGSFSLTQLGRLRYVCVGVNGERDWLCSHECETKEAFS